MSQQGLRQASVRAVTGTELSYEGDWHALFDLMEVPEGDFNGRLLAYINAQMEETFPEVNGAMAAFAVDQGALTWSQMGTFDPGEAP